jgi:hypothetical protein
MQIGTREFVGEAQFDKNVSLLGGLSGLSSLYITEPYKTQWREALGATTLSIPASAYGNTYLDGTFTDADLVAGKLNIVHNLNTYVPSVVVFDSLGNEIIPGEVNCSNPDITIVDLTYFAPLIGTWRFSVKKSGTITFNISGGGGGGSVIVTGDITRAEVAALSGYLQSEILSISSNYTTLATTAAISSYLDTRINGLSSVPINLTSVTTDIVPFSGSTLSLGTSAKPWKELYLTGNSIYIGGSVVNVTSGALSIDEEKIIVQSDFNVANDSIIAINEEIIHIESILYYQNIDITNLRTDLIYVSGMFAAENSALYSTLQTVSGNLQSQIVTLRSDLVTISGTFDYRTQHLQTEIQTVSGNLQGQISSTKSDLEIVSGALNSQIVTLRSDLQTVSGALSLQIENVRSDLQTVSASQNSALNVVDAKVISLSGESLSLTRDNFVTSSQTIFLNRVDIGHLNVLGTTTTVDSEVILINDSIISLNSNLSGDEPYVIDSGIRVFRGSHLPGQLLWMEPEKYWMAGLSGSEERILVTSDFDTLNSNIISASGNLSSYTNSSVYSASASLISFINSSTFSASANQISYTNSSINSASGDLMAYVNSSVVTASGNVLNSTNSYLSSVSGNLTSYASTKIPLSYMDIDGSLSGNSDTRISSQKATKTYITNHYGFLPMLSGASITAVSGSPMMFLDIGNNYAKTLLDQNGNKTLIDEIVASVTSLAVLNASFPATLYTNKWAEAFNNTAEDGWYQSNGTSWIQRLGSSGDRTALWDFINGISYGASDLFIGANHSSNSGWEGGYPATRMFDGNDATEASGFGSAMDSGTLYADSVFVAATSIGKFTLLTSASTNRIVTFKVEYSIDGTTNWTTITSILSVVNGSHLGGGIIQTNTSVINTIVLTSHTIPAKGYRLRPLTRSGGYAFAYTFSGYSSVDTSSTINCVNSINKLNSRLLNSGTWSPDTNGVSAYAYESSAILNYNGALYHNKSGTTISAGATAPSADATNWEYYMPPLINVISGAISPSLPIKVLNQSEANGISAALYVSGGVSIVKSLVVGGVSGNATIFNVNSTDQDFKVKRNISGDVIAFDAGADTLNVYTTNGVYISGSLYVNGIRISGGSSGVTISNVRDTSGGGTGVVMGSVLTNNAPGNYAVAEGADNLASGTYSHAEGYTCRATNDYAHVEGWLSLSSGVASHAEGNSTASGDASHSEGNSCVASASFSHAEGEHTSAANSDAHAEGYYTTANGQAAHSEGDHTTASGNFSHAEGSSSAATGVASHAEGKSTLAEGTYSHAEGYIANAYGAYSHAEGFHTTAIGDISHAAGSYATAMCANTFVWSDGSAYNDIAPRTFNIRATNGVYISGAVNISDVINIGGQIKFPATQNASSDANTLDDYEEGTFTPSLSLGLQEGSFAYNEQVGRYTKIGNMVYIDVAIYWASKPISGDGFQLDSLPFAIGSPMRAISSPVFCESIGGSWTGSSPQYAKGQPSSTSMVFYRTTTGNSSYYSVSDIPDGARIDLNVVYRV